MISITIPSSTLVCQASNLKIPRKQISVCMHVRKRKYARLPISDVGQKQIHRNLVPPALLSPLSTPLPPRGSRSDLALELDLS